MKNLFNVFFSKFFLTYVLLLSISLPVSAAESFNLLDGFGGQDDILDVDDAFKVSYDSQPGQFKINWVIADGHYLYRDKMQITASDPGVITKPLLMPAGEAKEDPIFKGVNPKSSFYFVHSYYVKPASSDSSIATSDYGIDFTAAVRYKNIVATQFHPEKSGESGLKILSNFCNG